MSEEETVFTQSPSQILNIRSFVSTIFACAAIIVLYSVLKEKFSLQWYVILLCIIPLFLSFWKYLQVKCMKFELTTERLKVISGVLNRNTEEIELYRIKDTSFEEPFYFRIFGLGNIKIYTSDRSLPELNITALPKGKEFREKLRDLVEDIRAKKNVREVDFE
ncbi:MAG: PH domain-containing protein [Lentisphaeraceae bacterium]|nr:PH domain-containing protein [Lentisphaeraceae bacterium]